MGEQLAMPGVSLEQRVQPDPVTLTALASQGASLAIACAIAAAVTLGGRVEFLGWYEHPEDDRPVWIVWSAPPSMHVTLNACLQTWVSNESWFWVPDPAKVPKPRRLESTRGR